MPAFFVKIAFADQTLYLWSGIGPFVASGTAYSSSATFPYGTTFTGLGWLGKISSIPQVNKIQAQNVVLSLSGIPSTLLTEAINQVRITGSATIWFGFLNTSTNALIADPVQVFSGSLDVPTLQDSGETCTISITAENTLISLQQAPNRQFDDMDQQIYFPGDLGFSFIDALPNMALFWPVPYNFPSPFPVDMVMSPAGADIEVGGTVDITTTINYSDGSHYTLPGGTGSGPEWIGGIVSMNPKVATVDGSGVVTGISPGIALIVARAVYPGPSSYTPGTTTPPPGGTRRVSCTVIVSSPDCGVSPPLYSYLFTQGSALRAVTPAGIISQLSLTSSDALYNEYGGFDGPIEGLGKDSFGNVYVTNLSCVWLVDLNTNVVTRVAGNGTAGYTGDGGSALSAECAPYAVTADSSGNVYFIDQRSGDYRVRVVNMQSSTQTLCGATVAAGDIDTIYVGGTGVAHGSLAIDGGGNVYVTDGPSGLSQVVYKIAASTGSVTTYAGDNATVSWTDPSGSEQALSGDGGAATSAGIGTVISMVTDSEGNLYIVSAGWATICDVTTVTVGTGDAVYTISSQPPSVPCATESGGIVGLSCVAVGTWSPGTLNSGVCTAFAPDSSATLTQQPDGSGTYSGVIYAGLFNYIRKIATSGNISAFCGNGLTSNADATRGDGGAPLSALLGTSAAIAVGSDGTLYWVEPSTYLVRSLSASTALVSTVAGINGSPGDTGNGGAAIDATLSGLEFIVAF